MKIAYVSDLHLDVWRSFNIYPKFPEIDYDTDVIVIAGDIADHRDYDQYVYNVLRYNFDHERIIIISGNHDARNDGDNFIDTKISRTIDGVKFAGCTLWTNFWGKTGKDLDIFRRSDVFGRGVLTPERSIELFNEHWKWLENEEPDVVVTHFSPFIQSIHPKYAGNPYNPYFANNQENTIDGVKLWIHGHTHTAFDYMHQETRVVCNPWGNPGERFSHDVIHLQYIEI